MVSRGTRSTSGMDPRNAPPAGTLVIVAEHEPVAESPAPQRLRTASIRRPHPQFGDASIHHSNQLTSILARLEILDEPYATSCLHGITRGAVVEIATAG